MSLKSILSQVDKLKAEFEALKPLKKEDEERLWKKFRLDWNYNSNHIEGNTLTYTETELLIIFDRTTGEHTMREYEEMQAHDVTIKLVQEAAEDNERPLNEPFIRQLNEILLVKPFYKAAKTPDGQSTRRKIIPGEYKKHPNSVKLENGEEFQYAAPQEVPILMGDLITSYNQAIANARHPIEIAAMLHYKFVRIHPFDDGNGRVARLLMNYVLLYHGYQPAIIKTDAKKEYLTALNKTDVLNPEIEAINNIEPFAEYIANQLLWSYEISIKSAKGESIVEAGDFEKRLNKLSRDLQNKKEIQLAKHQAKDIFWDKIFPFITNKFLENSKILSSLFLQSVVDAAILYPNSVPNNKSLIITSSFDKDSKELYKETDTTLDFEKIQFSLMLYRFKKNGEKTFDSGTHLIINLSEITYSVGYMGQQMFFVKKYYDELPSNQEMNQIFEIANNEVMNSIEKKLSE